MRYKEHCITVDWGTNRTPTTKVSPDFVLIFQAFLLYVVNCDQSQREKYNNKSNNVTVYSTNSSRIVGVLETPVIRLVAPL